MLINFSQIRLANRGNALVLSVLMLVTLSSVGVLSIQHTNTDLMVSGNLMRVAKNELATENAIGLANANLRESVSQELETPFDKQRRSSVKQGNLNDGSLNQTGLAGQLRYSTADPGPSDNNDGTWFLPVVAPADLSNQVLVDQGMAFQVTYYPVVKSNTLLPGNSTDLGLCYMMVDVEADGATPTGFQYAEDTLNGEVVLVKSRSRVIAGPVRCDQ